MSEPQNPETALAVVNLEEYGLLPETIEATHKIDELVTKYSPAAIAKLPGMARAVVLAKGMHELRKAMSKDLVEKIFMPLMGSRLGFKTDKDSKPEGEKYPWEIVRECVLEALFRGIRPINNEMNIIGGGCYATLESYERRLDEFPGLTNLEIAGEAPAMKDGGALVPYRASWKLNGKPDELNCIVWTDEDGVVHDDRIPVRVNSGQIIDATMGKAKKKMKQRIWARITGVRESYSDAIDTEGEVVQEAAAEDKKTQGAQAAAENLAAKHRAKKATGKADKPAEPPADPAAGPDGNPEPGADG